MSGSRLCRRPAAVRGMAGALGMVWGPLRLVFLLAPWLRPFASPAFNHPLLSSPAFSRLHFRVSVPFCFRARFNKEHGSMVIHTTSPRRPFSNPLRPDPRVPTQSILRPVGRGSRRASPPLPAYARTSRRTPAKASPLPATNSPTQLPCSHYCHHSTMRKARFPALLPPFTPGEGQNGEFYTAR